MNMVPAVLDIEQMLADLTQSGWLDQKLETACGLSNGYIRQLRVGRISRVSWVYGARLYNLWVYEMSAVKARPCVSALTLDATTS